MKDINITEQLKDKGINSTLLLETFQDIPKAFFYQKTYTPIFAKMSELKKPSKKQNLELL